MDVFSNLLRTFKLNAHVFMHSRFYGSWAVDTSGSQKATFHMIARGSAWLHLPDQNDAISLHAQDLVIFPRDARHTITNTLEHPKTDIRKNEPGTEQDGGPATSLICGFFEFEKHHWNPLLDALPEVMIIRGEQSANTALMDSLLRFIIYESETGSLGGDVVIDKLSEVLFIHAVRNYMQINTEGFGYLAALSDLKIAQALLNMHERPDHPWTLDKLAEVAGMSRSSFADRFQQLVSMTPVQYLTRWRMQLAHEMFEHTYLSVAQVAEKSAYKAEAAFSKAFKKQFGYGPGAVRRNRKKAQENLKSTRS